MTQNKKEIVEDVQSRLDNDDISIRKSFIQESVDRTFDTDSVSILEHEQVVKHVYSAIKEAHERDLLKDSVYGEDDGIVVEEIPDITELNYK